MKIRLDSIAVARGLVQVTVTRIDPDVDWVELRAVDPWRQLVNDGWVFPRVLGDDPFLEVVVTRPLLPMTQQVLSLGPCAWSGASATVVSFGTESTVKLRMGVVHSESGYQGEVEWCWQYRLRPTQPWMELRRSTHRASGSQRVINADRLQYIHPGAEPRM
jgi:hypothetical protein